MVVNVHNITYCSRCEIHCHGIEQKNTSQMRVPYVSQYPIKQTKLNFQYKFNTYEQYKTYWIMYSFIHLILREWCRFSKKQKLNFIYLSSFNE